MAFLEGSSLSSRTTSVEQSTAGKKAVTVNEFSGALQQKAYEQHAGTTGFEAVKRICWLRHVVSLNKTNDYEAASYCIEQPLEPGKLRTQSARGWLLRGVVETDNNDISPDVFVTHEGLCYKNPVAGGAFHFSFEKGIPPEEWHEHGLDTAAMCEQLGFEVTDLNSSL